MALRLRKVWLIVHRWLGLTAGLLFAFAGLTGSLIAFSHELDEWLNPRLLLTSQLGEPKSVQEILSSTKKQAPAPGRISNVFLPRTQNGVFTLHFREQDKEKSVKGATVEVFVDPFTGEILGQRTRDNALMAILLRLHTNLLYGDVGRTLLGGVAVLALISLVSGLLLWWPLIQRGMWTGFGIRRRMFNYDLHKSVGAASLPVLLLVVLTSVYLTLPGFVKPLVKAFSVETKLPGKVKSTVPETKTPPIGADAAIEIARREMPGCKPMSVELPMKADDSYRVFVRQEGEVGEQRGVGRVYVDQYSGDCLAMRDWRQFTFADAFFRIQLALHTGDAFGLVARWLFLIAGLMPSLLYVTGFIMWRRHSMHRKVAHQTAQAQLPDSVRATPELVTATEAQSAT